MADRSEIVYYVGREGGQLSVQTRANEKSHASISLTWSAPGSSSLYLRVRDDLPVDERKELAVRLNELADAILRRGG
jgi:hypothetical protein